MFPQIAFLIINRNDVVGLDATLECISNQSKLNYECFVISNVATNNSNFCSDHYNNKIDFFVIKEHHDIYSGIDEILPKITSQYIYILESGNILINNNVIDLFLNSSTENPDFIYGNIELSFLGGNNGVAITPNPIKLEDIIESSFNFLPSIIIRRDILARYKFYTSELRFAHDRLLLLKSLVLNCSSVHYVNSVLSKVKVYRHGGIHKISDEPLIAKEKLWIIDNYLPKPLYNLLEQKRKLENLLVHPINKGVLTKLVPNYLVNILMPVYRYLKYEFLTLTTAVFLRDYKKKWAEKCFNIPIIINNRNHITYLRRLITSLEKRGYKNIFIIDNDSNYSDLIDYYKTIPYKVFLLKDNVGFCALWDTEVFDLFLDQYYIYTDSDIEVVDECPDDFVVVMHYLLNKYNLGKVGLSLLTNDLPDHFDKAEEVKKWEVQFQKYRIEKLAYLARVDTTFALYKPNSFGHSYMLTAFRTSFPYAARHLPWYENTSHLTAEQVHYYENAKTSSHWSSQVKV